MSIFNNYNWDNINFLIADDDNNCHLLLDKALRKTGADVIHAFSGTEAIKQLESKENIDLALIDILMPGFNGYEVVEQTRGMCPGVIFVAYTADILRLDKQRCFNAGFSKYIIKPLLPIRLFSEMEQLLLMKKQAIDI